jgi:hypothetical protein
MSASPEKAAAPAAVQRTAWWLFAPPAGLAAVRWLLQWQSERGAPLPTLPLQPLVEGAGLLSALMPLFWGVGVLLVLALGIAGAVRRWGGPRVRKVLLWVWALLCLAGGLALVVGHLNRQGLQPLAPVHAQVLGSRPRPPNLHAVGGTELVLRVDGLSAVQQVVIDDPQAAQWRPGQRILLHWSHGRFWGLYVTRWQAGDAPAPNL